MFASLTLQDVALSILRLVSSQTTTEEIGRRSALRNGSASWYLLPCLFRFSEDTSESAVISCMLKIPAQLRRVRPFRINITQPCASLFGKKRRGMVLSGPVYNRAPDDLRTGEADHRTRLSVNGCFSVASPSFFLTSVAASRCSVSVPYPYPSCLCLPLHTPSLVLPLVFSPQTPNRL
jgi:hypothetical protein